MKYFTAAGLLGLLLSPLMAEDKKPATKPVTTYEIPYRLTDTKHVLVRVKINDKGPFNFIIDTGAPALILTEALAKKVEGKTADGWTTFDKVELEGGLSVPNPRGVAVDMFQLKGMNSMGLAGVELHGVLGYNVLAQYKIEYDFTETKLKWTSSDFKVPAPKRITDKGGSQGGLEMMGDLMKMMSALTGAKPDFTVHPRGFLGAELETKDKDLVITEAMKVVMLFGFDKSVFKEKEVFVKTVLKDSPAEKAGLKSGDLIQSATGKRVASATTLLEAVKKMPVGTTLKLSVKRGDDTKDFTVELGKGL